VVTGDAAVGIVTAASETDADLIVMGVAPRTWLNRVLFGSTLGKVQRRAEIPVLVIPVIGGEHELPDATVASLVVNDIHVQSATARIAA
jgi:hypothetical protein